MAVSGSVDFTLTASGIISSALRMLNLLGGEDTASAEQISRSLQVLNLMLKGWQLDGIGLWLNTEATLFLEKEKKAYSLGPTGDHCTASYNSTTLASAATSGSSTITVSSTTGFSDAAYVGIEVDDGTMHWTTQDGAVSGSDVTLDDALDDDAAAGKTVYVYTTKINRPLEILNANYKTGTNFERQIDENNWLSRDQYNALTVKNTAGEVISLFYDPQLTNSVLYTWPVPSNVTHQLVLTVKTIIDDMDAQSNNFSVPNEWLETVKYNLANRLIDEYGISLTPNIQRIIAEAMRLYENAKQFDSEQSGVRFVPDNSYYQ